MTRILLAGALLLAAPSPALAAQHEFYAQAGLDYYRASDRLVVGLGGGPGYRYHVSENLSVFLEQRTLWMAGNAFSLAAGGLAEAAIGPWRPAAGVRLVGLAGDQIDIISSPDPALPSGPALALQLRLEPIRFAQAGFSACALGLDFGSSVLAGGLGSAIGVTLLDVGMAF